MKKTIDDCFFQIQNGANIKQGDVDGGFPITRIETTANDKFNRDRMGYAGITDISKYESYVLEDGDLLMSHINSVQYLGRTVLYVKQTDETIIHGMNLLRLKARRDVINPAYARYCFYGSPFRRQVRKITKKSVNQASFAVKDLKQIKIDVPSLSEQEQIVEVLDKLQKIIEIRSNELSTLDNLIKARFVELFGDPINNPKGWEVVTIGDIVTEVKYGTSKPAVEGGKYPYLRMNNITYSGELDLRDTKRIDIPDSELDKCTVRRGDVLFNRTNSKELVGKTCVYNRDELMVLAGFVIRVRINERIRPEVLSAFLNMDFSKRMLIGMCKTAIGQANINAKELQNIDLYIPPIELQDQFVTLKNKIDQQKQTVQQSLEKLELLKKALMQEYFG